MAIFNFKTGNDHIDGKIDYTCTRTQEGFTIEYAVYMKRNNSYSGTATNGTINYIFYISDSYTDSKTKEDFTVPNNKTWAKIVSGKYTYKINMFNTGSFRVGFESNGERTAFNVEKQMSDSVSVPAYAVRPSLSSLSIVYTPGDNYFKFKGTIGNNGSNNNKITGCKVFYTTDGSTPEVGGSTTSSFTVTQAEKTNWEKQINITLKSGTQTIKARISTLAPLGGVDTPKDKTQEWTVAYYSPPYPLENLDISYDTSRPTPNSTYTFKWKLRAKECDGYNNSVKSYRINIYVKGALKKTITLGESETAAEGKQKEVELTGKELGLQKGDELKFSAVAIGNSQYNNTSSERFSSPINIVSAGVAKIKTSNNWKEGQVWIKTTQGWMRSTGVYVKTSSGWKQSL